MKVRIPVSLVASLLTVLLGLMGSMAHAHDGHDHEKGKAADEVMVSKPYARASNQKISGMFMMLKNSGDTDHAIVKVSGSVAQAVEMHGHQNDNGMMRMRPVEKITIPAGGHTMLQPGGLHVMLIGLNQTLEVGNTVHIKITFEDGSHKMITAPVQDAMPMNHGKGHHDMHDMKEHGHDDSHGRHKDHHDSHRDSHKDSHHDSHDDSHHESHGDSHGDKDMHDEHQEHGHGHNM